ncbi:MAG TPA: TonB-dependent receptor [Sphingobium sp.]|nr:TonB-dependent receptor [Sphingobium sp.]
MHKMLKTTTALGGALLSLFATSAAHAQNSATSAETAQDSGGLQEIVVTAQRRSENLQKVPIAVAVVTNEAIQAAGVTDLQSLKVVSPGVQVQNNNGFTFGIIRGVGSRSVGPGVELPIAVYVDGVYLASPSAGALQFNNIAQVEILKGPQGTLFGRNATGGLIQILTKDPKSDPSGNINFSFDNYDTLQSSAYFTSGIAENLSADIAFASTIQGEGYGTNLANGRDVYRIDRDINVRSKWLFTPGEDTELRLIFDYGENKNSRNAARLAPGATPTAAYAAGYVEPENNWDINANDQVSSFVRSRGVSLRVDHDLGSVKVASITAYRKLDSFTITDNDWTSNPTNQRRLEIPLGNRQFSQELQLLSDNDGPLTWMVGAYYFRDRGVYPDQRTIVTSGPAQITFVTNARTRTESLAGFGQATLALTDALNVTAGLRYTDEKRRINASQNQLLSIAGGAPTTTVLVAPFEREDKISKLTWRLAVDYSFAKDVLAYASFNRGFRSGGFNSATLTLPTFRPEVLDAYEVGLKTMTLDRRLRLNVAGFYYDYQDVQVTRVEPVGIGIYNAEGEEIYGGELELEAQITDQFSLQGGYQYVHARYKDFPGALIGVPNPTGGYVLTVGNAKGNHGAYAPEHSFTAAAKYTVPLATGELVFNANVLWQSDYFPEPDNVVREQSYELVNGSIQWDTGKGITATIWGRNLTNSKVAGLSGLNAVGGTNAEHRIIYDPPRTYGVSLGFQF